jgi:alkaline phosphatase D
MHPLGEVSLGGDSAFTVALTFQLPAPPPPAGVVVWGATPEGPALIAPGAEGVVRVATVLGTPSGTDVPAKQAQWGAPVSLLLVHQHGESEVTVWSPDQTSTLRRVCALPWNGEDLRRSLTGPPGAVQARWFRFLGQAMWDRALDPDDRASHDEADKIFPLPTTLTAGKNGPALELTEVYEIRSDSVLLCCRGAKGAGTDRVKVEVEDTATGARRAAGEWPLAAEDDFTGGEGGIRIDRLEPDHAYLLHVVPGDGERWGSASVARARTAPGADQATGSFTFAVSSCMGGRPRLGDFAIYRDMLRHGPRFYLDLGDDPYADAGRLATEMKLPVYREEYRIQAATASRRLVAPHLPRIKAGWDDHEILDNFSNGEWSFGKRDFWPRPVAPDEPGIERVYGIDPHHPPSRVYLDARRALLEYNPIARAWPDQPDRLYRSFKWGRDVELFCLDTRTYRAQNNSPAQSPEEYERRPIKTMLGVEQRDWLIDAVRASSARWKIITSGVPFEKDTLDRGAAGEYLNSPDDTWFNPTLDCSFGAERDYIFSRLRQIPGILLLTGDQHIAQFHALPMGGGRFYHLTVGPGGMPKGRYLRLETDAERPAPGRLYTELGWGGLPGSQGSGQWEPPSSYATVSFDAGSGSLTLRIFATHDIRVTPPGMVYSVVLKPDDLLEKQQ